MLEPDPRTSRFRRRGFLATAAAVIALARHRSASGQDPMTAAGADDSPAGPADADELRLDYEQFLALANPVARELVRDTSPLGEERYLHTIAALAARLKDVPEPDEMRLTNPDGGPRKFIGANDGGDPFTVLHWRIEPGAVIGLHAHTYGNVVTLGLAGAARIQNFEMVGETDFDAGGTFRVRRCVEQLLAPGDINLVPISHRYCHGFVAGPEGARGLDITTRILPKRKAPVLEILGGPVDALGCIFEARWRAE